MSVSRRPTDSFALQVMLGLCLIWGVQQVVIKMAAPDIAPVMQAAARSGIAALLVGVLICCKGGWRQVPSTWRAGLLAGSLFGLEFSRRAEDGGRTFHEFFGISYDANYKIIFLYVMAVLLVLLTLLVIKRLLRMPLGRAWEALRDDEIACRSLGLNPTVIKLTAFAIGAAFAGFAGSFFAARQGFISPDSFTFMESAIILAIVVLGGMGSLRGVVIAAIVMTVLQQSQLFSEYRMLIFGILMVVMMLWRPQGLVPMTRHHVELPK